MRDDLANFLYKPRFQISNTPHFYTHFPVSLYSPVKRAESMEQKVKAVGYAVRDSSGVLSPLQFSRRAPRDHDVQLQVLYCGICHSDLHFAKNDSGMTTYPIVPGHEIVGVVTKVGPKVEKFKVGQNVGVGCMVDSCRSCDQCANHLENYCPKAVYTYNSTDKDGSNTYGGYSNIMVVDEEFVIRWPENFPLIGAPLLCAGITTYSPLKYFQLDKPGQHIGVVGLGGLGHVAVKIIKAFGSKVTVISSSDRKKNEAMDTLGVDSFVVSSKPEEMQAAAGTLDGILDTVFAVHPLQPLLSMLKPHGKLVMLSASGVPLDLPVFSLIMARKVVAGSLIGGVKETQEMIDFAAKHNIVPDVEVIPMDYVNTAMERLEKGDVKYRFVLDVGKTLKGE